jgi:hypothetical protein
MTTEIPSEYLTASLTRDVLMRIPLDHPYLFWTALIVFVIVCAWYGVYYLAKKKKKQST